MKSFVISAIYASTIEPCKWKIFNFFCKIFKEFFLLKFFFVAIPADPAVNPFMPKRYSQFQAMFKHFYTNAQLMKTYGYGCYCLNLGDRPLAGVMTGVYPVDDKAQSCIHSTNNF